MAYRGRRFWGNMADAGETGALFRVWFFPVQLFYLELLVHLYMGLSLKYLPVWFVFSVAGGLFLAAFTLPFPERVNRILFKFLMFFYPSACMIEIIAKKILQTFYPASSLKTALGNRLSPYLSVIVSTVLRNLPIALAAFAPAILVMVFGKKVMDYQRYSIQMTLIVLLCAVVAHLAGLGVLRLPWTGDMTPLQLYHMDTAIDDQVEQLGIWNMLRLDVKHQFVRPKGAPGGHFAGAETPAPSPAPSAPPPAPSGSPEPSESAPVIDTSPQVMDVDLEQIAADAPNDEIRWLAEYFQSVEPTRKNEYTGMFQDYNVIFFTLEGFSGYAIDPELTPTLYRMAHEGFYFTNYYTPLHFTSTSGGECQNLLGIYPKNGFPVTMSRTGELGFNPYFCLAQQLGREGYQVLGYHANTNMYGRNLSHPNLGYDWHQYGESGSKEVGRGKLSAFDGLEVSDSGKLLWPQRDSWMIEASADDYLQSDTPFHVYYLTISGHMPYSDNRIVAPYRETVRTLPYSETTQNYIATAMEVDRAMETLIQKLDEAGKLEHTLIVATPDHIPYFDAATLEELTGETFGSSEDLEQLKEDAINFDVYRNTLIIWSESMEEPVEVDKVCGQVDILPTVSNLLGLEYDSRMLDGKDILSDSEGLVIFSSRCWKSDRGLYNRFTQEFTPAEGVAMTPEEQEAYVSATREKVKNELESTDRLIESDFYNYVFGG